MKKYIAEEIYPRSQTGRCMVYFNMSHHYRRIYSAKPRIDTNLIKKPQLQFCCSSPDVFNFVKRSSLKQPLLTPRHQICIKEKEPELFKPKILESHVESKLKSLPVYQAPQRIFCTKAIQTEVHNIQLINDNHISIDNKDVADSLETKPMANQPESESSKNIMTPRSEVSEGNKKFSRPLDKSTVLFLKDITDDILRKGIYSNQSLDKLFVHHISKNKYNLPKEAMEKEIARLKMELEIPIEVEKQESEESIRDEEALMALNSLLLPSDIRDKVASSLGLIQKSPLQLPSPKDSFTGSLELTSMSEIKDDSKLNITNDNNASYDNNDNVSQEINNALQRTTKEAKKKDTHESHDSSFVKESFNFVVVEKPDDAEKSIIDDLNSVDGTRTITPNSQQNDSKFHEDEETSSELSSIHTESNL